jgi:glycosyltransferase involved in cell wall biosynthesis
MEPVHTYPQTAAAKPSQSGPRVLLLSQHFWPESLRINDVALDLQGAGCQVTVLTGQPNYPGGRVFEGYRAMATGVQTHQGLTIHRVPLAPRGRGGALRLMANYLSFIAAASIVGAWRLRGQRFDVIFVYASSPILQAIAAIALARLKRCAVVTWVQDLWPESLAATGYVRHPRLLRGMATVVRWIYHRCDLLLVQSEAFIPPVLPLAGATPVRYHPNPGEVLSQDLDAALSGDLAENSVTTSVATAALTLQPGFNLVFAGNLGMAQALDSVLDAAELLLGLPGFRLVLVGSGQRSAWLAEQVAQRGLHNVQLAGRFEPQHMPAILDQASALLVSLVDDPAMRLTVPSKVQSYLAAGKPIIAALDGEGARLVQACGAGIACGAAKPQALADAVRSLHAMTDAQRLAFGRAGQLHYRQHFDPAQLAIALRHHLSWAAAKRSGAAATIVGSKIQKP